MPAMCKLLAARLAALLPPRPISAALLLGGSPWPTGSTVPAVGMPIGGAWAAWGILCWACICCVYNTDSVDHMSSNTSLLETKKLLCRERISWQFWPLSPPVQHELRDVIKLKLYTHSLASSQSVCLGCRTSRTTSHKTSVSASYDISVRWTVKQHIFPLAAKNQGPWLTALYPNNQGMS